MATSLTPEIDLNAEPEDRHEQTLAEVAAKYEQIDEAAYRAAHPEAAVEEAEASEDEGEGEAEESDESADPVDDDDEDSTEDTSAADPDGDADESDADSPDGEDEEHPEGDTPADSPETPADDDEADEPAEAEDAEEDDELSKDFTEVAKLTNIPVTIEDVPEGPARQLAQQKLRSMDQAFTRVMQQATAFRKDEVAFRAEERFRTEHPELAVIEMFEKHPELLDRVNEQYGRLTDDLTKKAFGIVVTDARKQATDTVTAEIAKGEATIQRVQHVETLGQRIAHRAGLPWHFAETAIANELNARAARNRDVAPDLTDEEVAEIVGGVAKHYTNHVRAHKREASKKAVQERTANRKSTPGSRTPAAAASPKPAPGKKKAIDLDNEDQRRGRMMEFAKRQFPGARDDDDEE